MTKRAPKTKTTAAVSDGLMNVVTGSGTGADKTAHDFYAYPAHVSDFEAINAYRSSGLCRKIHDLPPMEMTREWRSWQADDTQIERIEAEEKRLGLRDKAREALKLARLTGGALIVMGLPGAPSREVTQPSRLRYIHVFPKQSVGLGPTERDIASPYFGTPKYFEVEGVRLHPSRVVPVIANKPPQEAALNGDFWGEPLMVSIGRALKNCDATQNNIAALVPEAKTDIIGIPGLTTMLMNAEYEAALTKRMAVTALFKSVHNATLIDSAVQGGVGETWDTRQLSFGGLPDIQRSFNVVLAAVSDIPYTRLFGESPGGLQTSGDNEQRDFERMIKGKQDVELRPVLERIDPHLIYTALGTVPPSVHWRFSPLSTMNEKEAADVDSKNAQTWKTLVDGGLIPSEVAMAGVKNQLIESGRFPGIEAAYERADAGLDIEPLDDPGDESDLSDALTQVERDALIERIANGPNDGTTLSEKVRRLWDYLTGKK